MNIVSYPCKTKEWARQIPWKRGCQAFGHEAYYARMFNNILHVRAISSLAPPLRVCLVLHKKKDAQWRCTSQVLGYAASQNPPGRHAVIRLFTSEKYRTATETRRERGLTTWETLLGNPQGPHGAHRREAGELQSHARTRCLARGVFAAGRSRWSSRRGGASPARFGRRWPLLK